VIQGKLKKRSGEGSRTNPAIFLNEASEMEMYFHFRAREDIKAINTDLLPKACFGVDTNL
jgi:hypothetical protein